MFEPPDYLFCSIACDMEIYMNGPIVSFYMDITPYHRFNDLNLRSMALRC